MTATLVFAATYLLIATRRLRLIPIGRPAGALLGACAMVAFGVMTPAQSYDAVDFDTIVLLLGMMLLTADLSRTGVFAAAGRALARRAHTPRRLLALVALVSAMSSALLVNDTVCLLFTPVVVGLCVRLGMPIGPFLMAVATSANIGSALTVVGNPQNMLVGSMSGVSFVEFSRLAAPATIAAMLVNIALLDLYYGRRLSGRFGHVVAPHPTSVALDDEADPSLAAGAPLTLMLVLGGVVVAFATGAHLGYATLSGAAVLILLSRRDAHGLFAEVDWTLLVFFAALFVVVHGFEQTGLVDAGWAAIGPWMSVHSSQGLAVFAAAIVVGSNLISNVPLIMLVGPQIPSLGGGDAGWVLLAWVATVAGNFTLLGSVANIIVAERAREHYELGFVEYLRFGVVSTLIVLIVGVGVFVATGTLG